MTGAHRLLALLVVVTFVTSFVAAGDGVGPIGYLMIAGWEYWTQYIVPAWIGVLCLFVGTFVGERSGRWVIAAGAGLLVLDWIAMLLLSDNALTTALFSTHFLACVSALFAITRR